MAVEIEENKNEIRLAVPEEALAIATVLRHSFAEYKALYTPAGFAATTPPSEEILSRMKEGPLWVALHNGTIVGTISLVLRGHSAYIRGMAVLPSARGLRLGPSLLEHAEDYAAEHNCKRLYLSTTPFLDRAIPLYQHFGFSRTDEGPHDLHGTPLFTMEKILRPRVK